MNRSIKKPKKRSRREANSYSMVTFWVVRMSMVGVMMFDVWCLILDFGFGISVPFFFSSRRDLFSSRWHAWRERILSGWQKENERGEGRWAIKRRTKTKRVEPWSSDYLATNTLHFWRFLLYYSVRICSRLFCHPERICSRRNGTHSKNGSFQGDKKKWKGRGAMTNKEENENKEWLAIKH